MGKGTILYVGGFDLPDNNAAAHRVINNSKILKKMGYNVILIGINKDDQVNEIEFIENNEFEMWTVKYPKSRFDWILYVASIKSVQEIMKKYDDISMLICYNYPSLQMVQLMNYARRRNIKVISDCTEWYDDKRFVKKIDTEVRMKLLNKKVDGVICISSFLEQQYSEFVETVVIPPLIDKSTINLERIKSASPSADNVVKLIYTGSPGKTKDKLDYIIESLYKLRSQHDFRFVVVGLTKEQYLFDFPNHKEIIKSLSDKICFLGRISHTESILNLQKADFQVFFRQNTRVNNAGFPTKFVESISSGIPVITTRTSDLEIYLRDFENGFFIDGYEKTGVEKTLENILKLNRSQINYMKKKCINNGIFHYENYQDVMSKFLNVI